MIMRLALLAICLATGSLIGWAGRQATGHDAWFLALPLLLSGAWFWVSDPSRCQPADIAWAATNIETNRDFDPESDPGPPTEPQPPRV